MRFGLAALTLVGWLALLGSRYSGSSHSSRLTLRRSGGLISEIGAHTQGSEGSGDDRHLGDNVLVHVEKIFSHEPDAAPVHEVAAAAANAATMTTTTTNTGSTTTWTSHAADGSCYFNYDGGPSNMCFCQLAGNRGCANTSCACSQGCGDGVTWDNPTTVTFRNKAIAVGCNQPTALLTIPKSYFSHVKFLKTWCPTGMLNIITQMLINGFNSYVSVHGAPAHQCIHAATKVSVDWFHLHTFCPQGSVDQMPPVGGNTRISWCAVQNNVAEAPMLAQQVVQWAVGLYGPIPTTVPGESCASMGCNNYGPSGHCSCNQWCRKFGDCCADYVDTCHPPPPPPPTTHKPPSKNKTTSPPARESTTWAATHPHPHTITSTAAPQTSEAPHTTTLAPTTTASHLRFHPQWHDTQPPQSPQDYMNSLTLGSTEAAATEAPPEPTIPPAYSPFAQ